MLDLEKHSVIKICMSLDPILFYFIFKTNFLKLKQVGQLSQLDFTNNIFLI